MVSHNTDSKQILDAIAEDQCTAIMSYLSKRKWHVTKVSVLSAGAACIKVSIAPRKDPHPVNISLGQCVGMSVKYNFGKILFETKVIDLEPSLNPEEGGIVVLELPNRIEAVDRRSYYRIPIPKNISVKAKITHAAESFLAKNSKNTGRSITGNMVDISAGGLQVAVDAKQCRDFKQGQTVTIGFIPMENEETIELNAQIRSILPTANENDVCLGLQMIGLESTRQGRDKLRKLVRVVETYHQINKNR